MSDDTECPSCGKSSVIWKHKAHKFDYGTGETKVTLSADMPVGHCTQCKLIFTDNRGEEARAAAVKTYQSHITNGRPWLSREG